MLIILIKNKNNLTINTIGPCALWIRTKVKLSITHQMLGALPAQCYNLRSRSDSNRRNRGFADLALRPLEHVTCGAQWNRTTSSGFSVQRTHQLYESSSISVPGFPEVETDIVLYAASSSAAYLTFADFTSDGIFSLNTAKRPKP